MVYIPSGVQKSVIVSKESTWGTKPAAGTGKYVRRVSLDLNLTRDNYESAEISSTAQTSDSRNGMNKIEGTLSAELSCGTYADLFAAIARGAWVAGTTNTAATIAAAATGNKLVRSTGDWITLGFRVGDPIVVSGFTTPATANNTSFVILSVTTTDLVLGGNTLVTKAEGDSVTVAVDGKKLTIPLLPASRTDDSFTFEQFYQGVNLSEIYTGVKVGKASLDFKPSAMSTVEFELMGKAVETGVAQYFTTPTAASTTASLSGSSGEIYFAGVKVATITSLTTELGTDIQTGEVLGSRDAAALFMGRIKATGTMSAYFTSHDIFTKFVNETEVTVAFKQTGATGEQFTIVFPRVKLGSATKSDEENNGCLQEIEFTALLPTGVDTSVDQSTFVIIDSEA